MQSTTDARTNYSQEARAILGGTQREPKHILHLAKALADLNEFELARRILEKAYERSSKSDDSATYIEIIQKRALYTYKDTGLRKDERLEEARKILTKDEVISQTIDPETLGLAGAIYKRRWEVDSQKQNLELALRYYSKGYRQGPKKDRGYTGINAAFLLDVLADQEDKEAHDAGEISESADTKRKQAEQIRREIIQEVEPLESSPDPENKIGWWFYATIGEAYFGLKEYDKATEWLVNKPEKKLPRIAPWERESTARQLAALARLQSGSYITEQEFVTKEAGQGLMSFLKSAPAVSSAFVGKLGLALSGGGFRASLFHIGVLAILAEKDLLRRVEVLSCVSGGSIIGAHYYLALRNLLQSKPDQDICQGDYIKLVKEIEGQFLAGVQSNIRTRVLAELTTNFKRVFLPRYSRTQRVGELYEREIFSRVEKDEAKRERLRRERLWLDELHIHPYVKQGEQSANLAPDSSNWERRNKVPMLVLNATTLNTGHSWHFTTSSMGEPPALRGSNIESNYRLRRMRYNEAPEKHRKVSLGYAVAASSCVPGLFEPLALDGLYPDKSVLLVDGGVCDNQGVQGLLENDCNVILVSDGSGQMGALDTPTNGLLGVPLRSSGISQARVREAQYYDLRARKRSSLLREFLFVHLKQSLDASEIDWQGCPAHSKSRLKQEEDRTGYGISRDIQELLAGIRTDLDSFCEAEAYALMTSAYRMTEQALNESEFFKSLSGTQERGAWTFLGIEKSMQPEGAKKEELKRLLKASGSRGFKLWRISKPLKYTRNVLSTLLVVMAVIACFYWPGEKVIPGPLSEGLTLYVVGWALVALIGTAVGMFVLGKVHKPTYTRLLRWRQSALYILTSIMMLSGGWGIARLHLWVFDRCYIKLGQLKNYKS